MSETKIKLKKRDVMTVSRILKDINFKKYVDDLMGEKLDKILGKGTTKQEKIFIVLGDLFAYVTQNMADAEVNIDILIKSYKGINQDEIEEMDIDQYVLTLKEIFFAGIPDIIGDVMDISDIKKKLQQEMKESTPK